MIGHDDALLDDVALLALGVLPRAEAERVAAHVRSCAMCRAEYAELRATADMIGFAATESLPADEMTSARRKNRVMNAVRGGNGEFAGAAAPAATDVSQPTPIDARRRRPYLAFGAAAAAAVIALASITSNIGLRRSLSREQSQVTALKARTGTLDSALAEVVAPDSKRFAVPGGQVITRGGRVFVALRDLPSPGPGKVYQAWTLANGAKAVAPSLTFIPDPGGIAVIELPESAANIAAVAVSVEPAGGSKAPTTKPTFIRKLS